MRWPNIVLEGPDGAGKTYTANLIMQRESYSYRHEGVPANEERILDYYHLAWEGYPKPVVADRFIAGQLVYGPVMRDGARITFDEAYQFCVDHFWGGNSGEADTLHVLCLPALSQCLIHWNKRNFEGREYVKEYDKFRRVHEGYAALAKKGLFDIVVGAMTAHWVHVLFDGRLPLGGDVLWVTNLTLQPMTLEDFSKTL